MKRRRLQSPELCEDRIVLDGASALVLAAEAEGELAYPDFSLVDVNTTSPTYNQEVSPSDYLGEVSAWYFGHAT